MEISHARIVDLWTVYYNDGQSQAPVVHCVQIAKRGKIMQPNHSDGQLATCRHAYLYLGLKPLCWYCRCRAHPRQ